MTGTFSWGKTSCFLAGPRSSDSGIAHPWSLKYVSNLTALGEAAPLKSNAALLIPKSPWLRRNQSKLFQPPSNREVAKKVTLWQIAGESVSDS
jgi:hypothetical protein